VELLTCVPALNGKMVLPALVPPLLIPKPVLFAMEEERLTIVISTTAVLVLVVLVHKVPMSKPVLVAQCVLQVSTSVPPVMERLVLIPKMELVPLAMEELDGIVA